MKQRRLIPVSIFHIWFSGLRFRVLMMQMLYFPLVLFLVSTIIITRADAQVEDGFAGKVLPEKGDTKCPSLADRFDNYKNGADSSVWLYPCQDTPDSDAPPEKVPAHGIALEVFAALPAFAPDLGTSSPASTSK